MTPTDACKQALDLAMSALEAGWLSDADVDRVVAEVCAVVQEATLRLVA